MSRWCQIGILVFIVVNLSSTLDGRAEKLSVCGPSSNASPRSLAFVSTLDGKLSALDIGNNGELQWTVDFGGGPMLSSNIQQHELNNDGQWVRLIPSLNGGLYKFDGENLETIPVTTDQLLRSSFRYSDDLVFSGGKETRSYGISTLTGHILYECNISGCTNKTDGDSLLEEEVLVVQRFQQTVRAVVPRTGVEKWNFSVGQHDLVLMPRENHDCDDKVRQITRDIELHVIVPEGLVWAINKTDPRTKLWQYKFDSPIVSIWRDDTNSGAENHASLKEVDLFDGSQWTWGSEFPTRPGIYIGMHDRQLYVQENTDLTKMMEPSSRRGRSTELLKFPWQPFPAAKTALAIKSNEESDNNDGYETSSNVADTSSTTALSVLYNSKYINGNGFYLYVKLDSSSQCNGTNPNVIIVDNASQPPNRNYEKILTIDEEDDTPVQVIIVSLWYWWKEVVIISVTTAVLLNCMLAQRFINERTPAKDAGFPPVIVETHVEIKKEPASNPEAESAEDFKSRYRTDFEHIDCLGKGGYGVVFEAKNKIDDCNYAIKRICLPNSRDSRDRVMREVKALAKLEHQNIVRYFNAWLECPPAGWQEKQDELYLTDQKLSPSEFPSEYTQSATKPNSSVCIEVPHSDNSSVDSAMEAVELNNGYGKGDDSFIVFEGSGTEDESAITEEIGDSSHGETRDDESESSEDLEVFRHESINENDTRDSESIVFRHSGDKNSLADKESIDKRKASFSLQFKDKVTVKKSAKMFLYIQMQLCQKLSLREWLKRQPQSRDISRVVNIFQQIVDAVEYVHLQGLIHRDLKPSNIFFAYDEKIKIGDFGLVTAMTEGYDETLRTPDIENSTTRSQKNGLHTACVGTHLYMSPEQMNGQIYNYKVDIYSLGIILFELLIPFFTEMERIDALMSLRKSIFPHGFADKHPAEYDLLRIMLDENPMNRPTTLGIKARRPLSSENCIETGASEASKWHFELPQISRHSSVTNSSTSGESWDKIEAA